MRRKVLAVVAGVWLVTAACAHKPAPAPAPPPAPQNVFALLPEPSGAASAIVVRNRAGSRELAQANQAVRVDRIDAAPSAPYALSDADVRRLFGPAIDVLPSPEIQFVLHFELGRDTLNTAAMAKIPDILKAIQDRHSTSITVTGHTDTTDTRQRNFELGKRRAEGVADILRAQGVKDSDLFVSSHGDADLLVKTLRNVPNEENRRVEVIVR
jgi:outer membrane protein OmpA-like peptidoglycan-associated protein